jgi:hypothetical protein
VLIASATADPDLLRQFFPTLLHRPPPAPAMPHVTIRQYHGGFGKRAMQRSRPALIERAQYEMQDLGKGGLTITYKQHAPAFREALGGANVAHHGGLIGADRFRHVDKALIFGGPFPSDREIARIASCEAGRIVPVEAPAPTPCRALLASGEGVNSTAWHTATRPRKPSYSGFTTAQQFKRSAALAPCCAPPPIPSRSSIAAISRCPSRSPRSAGFTRLQNSKR